MSQQGKRKTKSLLDFYTKHKIESFLAYFMRILNSCVVSQDSILQNGVCASQSSRTLSMLVFEETSAQPHFAVVNCSDVVMSVFHSYVFNAA